jgi:VWFA-related protein
MRPAPPPLDPDLILSYVTVTAPKNITPPRLSAKDFHILEDNVEQKIDYFAVQDQPPTVGIVWGAGTAFDDPAPDWSVRECPREFMKAMPLGSEYFVLSADTVTTSFTTDLRQIPINYARSSASTDSVYIGLDVLKEAANPRKILLIVTKPQGGGGGLLQRNYLERVVIRQGYQVHVVSFFFDSGDANLEGTNFLGEIADLTGGSFYMGPPSNVFCRDLARQLQVQYLIGYHPTNDAKNGKWRKLSVKVDSSGGANLKARIRRGYYANKE